MTALERHISHLCCGGPELQSRGLLQRACCTTQITMGYISGVKHSSTNISYFYGSDRRLLRKEAGLQGLCWVNFFRDFYHLVGIKSWSVPWSTEPQAAPSVHAHGAELEWPFLFRPKPSPATQDTFHWPLNKQTPSAHLLVQGTWKPRIQGPGALNVADQASTIQFNINLA